MVTVLVRRNLVLIHRQIIVVFPDSWRRLTRHPLETTSFSWRAIRLDIWAISLTTSVLVIARVWADSLTVMPMAVGWWTIVHHVVVTVSRWWRIVMVLNESENDSVSQRELLSDADWCSISPFGDPSSMSSSCDRSSCSYGRSAFPIHQREMNAVVGPWYCPTSHRSWEWKCVIVVRRTSAIDVGNVRSEREAIDSAAMDWWM